jgi:hypothetical protein
MCKLHAPMAGGQHHETPQQAIPVASDWVDQEGRLVSAVYVLGMVQSMMGRCPLGAL